METSFGFSITPEVGGSMPPISRRIVDLPQPEGPTKQKNSPSLTSKLTSEMAVTLAALYARETFLKSIILVKLKPFRQMQQFLPNKEI